MEPRPSLGGGASCYDAILMVGSSSRFVFGSVLALLAACGPGVGSDGSGSGGSGSSDDGTQGTTVDPTGADDGSGTEDSPEACVPGSTRACYDGPPESEGVGACMPGEQSCLDDGVSWSECVGATLPETELCLTPADEDCEGTIGCVPSLVWRVDLDGQTEAITTDAEGNVYVGGFGLPSATFEGAEIEDLFILSLTPEGALRWAHNVEELDEQHFTRLVVDAQGSVTGIGLYRNSPDFGDGPLPPTGPERAFLVRYDSDGTLQWSRALGPQLPSLAAASDGSIVLAGYSGVMQTLDGVPLTDDFYVASLDATGSLAWVRFGIGLDEYTSELRVTVRDDGTIVVLGQALVVTPVDLEGVALEPGLGGMHLAWSLDAAGTVLAGEVLPIERLGTLPGAVTTLVQLRPQGDEVEVALGLGYELPVEDYHNELLRLRIDASLEVVASTTTGTRVSPQELFPLPDDRTLLHASATGPQLFGSAAVDLAPDDWRLLLVDLDDAGQGRWAAGYSVSGNGPSFAGPGPVTADPSGAVFVTGYLYDGPSTLLEQPIDGGFILKLQP